MVLRQVRAVRRRSNLHVAQHAVAVWVASAAAAATLVVLTAVRGGRVAFALVALAGIGAVVVATVALARHAARRWLSTADAPARIDTIRGLRGRLASMLELGGRTHDPFFALLVRQNRDALPQWRPEDVVPEVVPARAFVAAVAAVSALVLAVVLAPALRAPPPRVEVGDRRMDFVAGDQTADDADRILVAPGTEHPAAEHGDGAAAATDDAGDAAGPVGDLSASLQDWLQQALGVEERWEPGDQTPPANGTGATDLRRARRGRGPAARPVADEDATGGAGEESGADGAAARRADGDGGGQPRGGGGGAGAGTETDPTLYGAPQVDVHTAPDRFELAIAARVRTRRGANMTPWTTAPGAEGGRPTTLAPQHRADQPGHRMAVPASLAPLVRRLYAHADPAGAR